MGKKARQLCLLCQLGESLTIRGEIIPTDLLFFAHLVHRGKHGQILLRAEKLERLLPSNISRLVRNEPPLLERIVEQWVPPRPPLRLDYRDPFKFTVLHLKIFQRNMHTFFQSPILRPLLLSNYFLLRSYVD